MHPCFQRKESKFKPHCSDQSVESSNEAVGRYMVSFIPQLSEWAIRGSELSIKELLFSQNLGSIWMESDSLDILMNYSTRQGSILNFGSILSDIGSDRSDIHTCMYIDVHRRDRSMI
jgi:hypothetical protein